jgi:membrane protease YdiL (CAAX protease family)
MIGVARRPATLTGPGTIVAMLGMFALLTRPGGWASPLVVLVVGAAAVAVPVDGEPERRHAAPAVLVGLAALAVAGFVLPPWEAPPVDGLGVAATVVAAVAEEALFRRVLYDRLTRYGAAVAILGSAMAFALVHLPGYGMVAFPVNLGAGVLFGWQRWATGGWGAPAATHAAANLMAVLG